MLINDIDHDARSAALTAANIDPHGDSTQYAAVLHTTWLYCAPHRHIHPATDTNCTVNILDKFPLATLGDHIAALDEALAAGFRITGHDATCQACHQTIRAATFAWLAGDDPVCPAHPEATLRPHRPGPAIPMARQAAL